MVVGIAVRFNGMYVSGMAAGVAGVVAGTSDCDGDCVSRVRFPVKSTSFETVPDGCLSFSMERFFSVTPCDSDESMVFALESFQEDMGTRTHTRTLVHEIQRVCHVTSHTHTRKKRRPAGGDGAMTDGNGDENVETVI